MPSAMSYRDAWSGKQSRFTDEVRVGFFWPSFSFTEESAKFPARMAAVMAQPGHERSPSFTKSRRMHTKSPKVRSPKSVLLPESPESSTESSSLASSILGEQIVECTSFRSPKKEDNRKNSSEATFEEVDDYTWWVLRHTANCLHFSSRLVLEE